MFKKLSSKAFLIGLLVGFWWWIRRPKPENAAPADPLEIPIEISGADSAEGAPPTPEAARTTVVEAPMAEAPAAGPAKEDDLIAIVGIGPKIAGILRQAGITTYAQLAEMDTAQLRTVLQQAGIHLSTSETWGDQAKALLARQSPEA